MQSVAPVSSEDSIFSIITGRTVEFWPRMHRLITGFGDLIVTRGSLCEIIIFLVKEARGSEKERETPRERERQRERERGRGVP